MTGAENENLTSATCLTSRFLFKPTNQNNPQQNAYLEEAAASAHVGRLDLVGAGHDGGAASFRNAVLVRLAHAAKHRDVGLRIEVMAMVEIGMKECNWMGEN